MRMPAVQNLSSLWKQSCV